MYGEKSSENHYRVKRPAETVEGGEFTKTPLISSELHIEWKTCHYSSKKQEEHMKAQLKKLTNHEMLVTMFTNLSTLSNICLSIPVSIASVERSFSQMKMIKTRLRNRIRKSSLNYLILIITE